MNSFAETGLNDEILRAIKEIGFETPTPIQAETIPHLLASNQNVIALAQTGTGKTAAFGLPSIHLTDLDNKDTQTIILCPTRELCLQIARDLNQFSKYLKKMNVVAVYGGAHIGGQIKDLNRGAQIVVGTPGRTKDLIKRGKLVLGNVQRVVLDEADEMLSMGFKDDLDAILDQTPSTKQTLLFSATMEKNVARIAKKYLSDAIEFAVATKNIGASNVEHLYHMVHAKDKYEVLKRIADINPNIYGIVFCRTRRETIEIANKLMHDGYPADVLNGDLSQAQRDEVMGKFRKRQIQILVATDVAARGIDVNDLTHILNYTLPDDPEVYTHRSGRTGRAGKSGISIAIIHTRETRKLQDIERKSGIKFSHQEVPTGHDICKTQLYTLIDKIVNIDVNETQIGPFLPGIYERLESLSREELIQHFVSAEFNRFLSYYKNARDINASSGRRSNDRNDRRDRDRGDRNDQRDRGDKNGDRGGRRRSNTTFVRLFINAGSKDRLNPSRLMGIVNEGLRSGNAEIGKIEILKSFSFFEIEKGVEDQVITSLKGKDFEGIPLKVEISESKSPRREDFEDRPPRKKRSEKRGGKKNEGKDWHKKGGKRGKGGNRRKR